jgi:FMN phosphatase YigB (HAD superfamily)
MQYLKGIKNIIFDFGNVIMDIDFQLTIDHFKELGFVEIEKFLKDYKSLGFFFD